MKAAVSALVICASPAQADAVRVMTSEIWAEPSQHDGAWVDVWFDNQATNGPHNNIGPRDLDMGIRFVFTFTSGADTIEVLPPEGYVCHPSCVITLPEHERGYVTLYSIDMAGA